MRRDGNKVILEKRACVWCDGTGKAAKQVICATCKGTGQGPKGGRSGCKKCSGMGHVYSRAVLETCTLCNGSGQVPENNCDSIGFKSKARKAILAGKYKVHIGYTKTGRDRWRRFQTIETATAFCSDVFRRKNIVLAIVTD